MDHNKLVPGLYLSRRDGDIVTLDLRFKKPNTGDLLSNSEMHSVEHLIATLLRNSGCKDAVIYFGPWGARPGFTSCSMSGCCLCGSCGAAEAGLCRRGSFWGGNARQEPGGVWKLCQS